MSEMKELCAWMLEGMVGDWCIGGEGAELIVEMEDCNSDGGEHHDRRNQVEDGTVRRVCRSLWSVAIENEGRTKQWEAVVRRVCRSSA